MGRILQCLVPLMFLACNQFRSDVACGGDSEPKKVEIGVYVNKFDQINLKDGKVDVDFFIWFRWVGDELKPFESFDLVNGQIISRDGLTESDLGSMKYACVRIRATIHKIWDVTRFPLDSHEILLEIESNEAELHKQVFVADTKNSGLNEKAQSAGWCLSSREPEVRVNRYSTNYGDTSLPTGAASLYSQFVFRIEITRPGFALFIKLFAGLYVAAGIAFLSLLIRPIDLDPRFGLGVGAMFAAVASQYVLSSNLPDTSALTMADELHILTFLYIFMTLLESTISLRFWNHGLQTTSQRIDRWSLAIVVVTYFAFSAIIIRPH